MSMIRINLNLIYFLDDHRQLTRMAIDDLKTIKDLQKYITRTFDIKKFYLMCDNYYLPLSSDIRVLSDNDIVLVVPSKKTSRNKNCCETLNSKNDTSAVMEVPEPVNMVEEMKKSSPRKIDIKILEVREIKPCEKYSLSALDQNNSRIENGINPLNEKEGKILKKSKNRNVVANSIKITPIAMDIAEVKENNDGHNNILTEEPCKQTVETAAAKKQKINRKQVNTDIELDKSTITDWPDCAIDTRKTSNNINTSDTNDISTRKSKGSKRSESLKCSGVGDVINFLNKTSDELQDSSNTEDTGIEYVTKRRRPRVRPRKRKRMENQNGELDTSQSETSIFRPPKSVANPLSHIIFEDDEEELNGKQNISNSETKDDNYSNTITKKFAHSTPYNKHLINMHKHIESPVSPASNGNVCRNQKQPKNKIDISQATLVPLSKQSPNVGSMLMFKRLKLANDYTPQISDYILAEVTELSKVGNQLTLKVLEGHKEFEEPRGKFSCAAENDEEQAETFIAPLVEHIRLDKNALIDAKLVINK